MKFLQSPQPPRLPDPPPLGLTTGFFASFSNALRLYFSRLSSVLNGVTGPIGVMTLEAPYAMLMSNADQTNPSTTGANSLTYNQPVLTRGIEVRDNSEIWFEQAGQYLVSFSLQVTNRSNAAQVFEVWAAYNGDNYPLSNTRYDIPARKSDSVWSHIVPAITGIFTVNDPDNDFLSIKWWASSTDVFLEHYAAQIDPTRPEVPSVIMVVQGVSRLPATA
jgi:hypothetical protein